MKKLLILLLVPVLLLSSCAGNGGVPSESDETTEALVETTSYKDVERRPTNAYKPYYYGFQRDDTLLQLSHPATWELTETEGGFDVLRDGTRIGALSGAPADDTADFTVLESEAYHSVGVHVDKYLEKSVADGNVRFRYAYEYTSGKTTRTVTLTASYGEVDERSEERLFIDVFAFPRSESGTVGALSDAGGDPSSLLILGNSFISSSAIGDILTEMLENEGRDCSVEAYSVGYANVGTFAGSDAYLSMIREDGYDSVFICGLYSESQVKNLAPLQEACDDAGVTLVVLPAHNESETAILAAKEEYPELFFLDWKQELDDLIVGGVDRWELCIDDAHDHSRPLAGYVGAHMIYRAIYGELPTESMRDTIDQRHIDNILGDYADVGDYRIFDEELITYLD